MTALERFKQYISYDTRSCGTGPDTPADSKPPELVQALAAELAQLGLQSVRIHSDGYLCGWLPSSPGCEGVPCVGLIASLSNTPGNRAGRAELLTAVELLSCQPALCHGRVALAAAPADTGADAPPLDLERFGAAVAYTLEPGPLGEIAYTGEAIEPHQYLILRARAAMESIGLIPSEQPAPAQAGGARLSRQGLPCPCLSTGASESAPPSADTLEQMSQMLVHLLTVQPEA